jgi:hypothetical protein
MDKSSALDEISLAARNYGDGVVFEKVLLN